MDRVAFRYPGGEPVLRDVTFSLAAGERLAVLGANGAGKSTLLLHMNGLLLPESGGAFVDGIPVREDTLREVRRRAGFVFQDPDDQLFLPTLLEDTTFGPLNQGMPPAEAERAARACLRHLGLEHAAGRAAHHLSGGEKRLAALATVLVGRPGILILDEPTAGLDARARRRVVQLLDRRPETMLVATHDLDVARALCRRAIVLAEGRVAALGSVAEVLDDTALLRAHGLLDPLQPAGDGTAGDGTAGDGIAGGGMAGARTARDGTSGPATLYED